MPDQLLAIKLYPPSLRPDSVSRMRLVEKMNCGLEQGACLSLVSAPAGYGKTTLVREWLAALGRPFAWLSLERSENFPGQFLRYLLAALNQATIISEPASSLHSSAEPQEIQNQLLDLVNQMASQDMPFVLVLDDYHTITEFDVHAVVEYLIAHHPPCLHLVIITRQDPLLPLSNLRARHLVTEIRLSDLRFTEEEAARFLNQTLKLGLDSTQVTLLARRTEGWIAGLQLAGLSLAEISPETFETDFFQNFSGDDRYIMDYLMDEVLSREPAEIQQFLLNTSILKRLSGGLCDAVMGPEWMVGHSQELLERLEKANLFIIPLDNRRQWYRYHHLFADLLTGRLQAANSDSIPMLHERASRWFEQEHLIADAVDHALLAEDFDRALQLIEQTAEKAIWASGDLPILLNWSRRLPEDVLATRPRLSLYYARGLFFSGQVTAAENCLFSAEQALRNRASQSGKSTDLYGVLSLNRATIAAMRGDARLALELVDRANQDLREPDCSTRARLAHAVGVANLHLGNVRAAEAAFASGFELSVAAGNRNLGLDIAGLLGRVQLQTGRLATAVQTCENALAVFSKEAEASSSAAVQLSLALIAWEQGDLPAARQAIVRSLRLARQANWPHILIYGYALQVRIEARLQPQVAKEALLNARQAVEEYGLAYYKRLVEVAWLYLELARGRTAGLQSWLDQVGPCLPSQDIYLCLALARTCLALEQPQSAIETLRSLQELADRDGRVIDEIEALTLLSAARLMIADHHGAQESLLRAIHLAAPLGLLRPLIEQQPGLSPLLLEIQRSGLLSSQETRLVVKVIGSVHSGIGEGEEFGPESPPRRSGEFLGEPLSERELEVLSLIAAGLSNPDIARRLFLSVNTLRAHTTHIYRKLDVHNRVQAVERARSLGLLPLI